MDRVLFLASNTGKQIMHAQTVNTNNLANANTVGFKKDFVYAQARAVHGQGHESRVYSQAKGMGADTSSGALMTTGRELDVAVRGEGWFAIQGLDGQEAYTRAGDLRVSAAGLLTTAAGHPVIGNNGGPMTLPPYSKLEIGSDGTVSVLPRGQEPSTMVVVDRIKLVKPAEGRVIKAEDGLFRTKDGVPAAPDASVQLISGSLESSNVNAVESMVQMMELARKYELSVKVMEKANELDSASAQLMRMS